MSKLVPIDFEYNTTNEQVLNLVSCSFGLGSKTFEYWLYNDPKAKANLKDHILKMRDSPMSKLFPIDFLKNFTVGSDSLCKIVTVEGSPKIKVNDKFLPKENEGMDLDKEL